MRKTAPWMLLLLTAGLQVGCGEDPTPAPSPTPTATATPATPTATPTPPTPTACVDADADGSCFAADCDDADDTRAPDLPEVCDGVDNNCNNEADEGLIQTWYVDADGDGYGIDAGSTSACEQPAGTAADNGDCDDTTRAAYPGRVEVCDGFDNDCDTSVDETPNLTFYTDADDDGYGAPASAYAACTAANEGDVAVGGDLDDTNGAINPGAREIWGNDVDEDCDTVASKANVYVLKPGTEPPEEGATTFTTIGAAIDAALSGLTIAVGPGVYQENLDYGGKDLKIIAMNGPEETTIDGSGSLAPVVQFISGEGVSAPALLQGFRLTGGAGADGSICGFSVGFRYGGAVCTEESAPDIIDCVMENNSVTGSGGAVWIEDGATRIENSVVRDNYATFDAGAINISNADAEIISNVIVHNETTRTGGAFVIYQSEALIEGNVIAFNVATGDRPTPEQGGGIYVSDAGPIVRNNIIAYNESGSSGGGVAVGNTTLKGLFENNTVVGNTAEFGGGFNVNAGSTTLVNNIIAFNSAPTGANMETGELGSVVTSYTLLWLPSGSAGVSGFELSGTDKTGDPAFTDDPADLNGADDLYTLKKASDAIDGGHPDASYNDLDTSRNDMGAYGGSAAGSLLYDLSDGQDPM